MYQQINVIGKILFLLLSGNDGVHMKNSKHYKNEAIDIRTKDMSEQNKVLTKVWIKKWLGMNYDVVLESDHIHIEYHTKQKKKSKKSDKIYKQINIRKEVIMNEPKKKINWLQVALDVLKVVLGALVGTQI